MASVSYYMPRAEHLANCCPMLILTFAPAVALPNAAKCIFKGNLSLEILLCLW